MSHGFKRIRELDPDGLILVTIVVSSAQVLAVWTAIVQCRITSPRDPIFLRKFAGTLRLEK